MSKKEIGSAKWMSNQIRKQSTKTKIRWYCGLCQVACKDENGYKCHLEHEGHIRRQMAMEDSLREFKPTRDDKLFRKKFLDYIAKKHFGQTVLAHDIYRDIYPIDRGHNIMKGTCWGTLGVFVSQLKKEGRIEAQKGLKGWQIRVSSDQFQESDIEDQEAVEKKSKSEKVISSDFQQLSLQRGDKVIEQHTESSERVGSDKVQFSLGSVGLAVRKTAQKVDVFGTDEDSEDG